MCAFVVTYDARRGSCESLSFVRSSVGETPRQRERERKKRLTLECAREIHLVDARRVSTLAQDDTSARRQLRSDDEIAFWRVFTNKLQALVVRRCHSDAQTKTTRSAFDWIFLIDVVGTSTSNCVCAFLFSPIKCAHKCVKSTTTTTTTNSLDKHST